MKQRIAVLPLFLIVPCLLALAACKRQGKPAAAADMPAPVTVRAAQRTTVKDMLALDGVVAPGQQVNLVARVAGTLDAIRFRDGEAVRRGQLLFVIEQAGYREQVRLNQARVDQAASEYRRQTQLLDENATSQASVDSALSTLRQADANLRLAKINLGYTEVRAPFDGIMGRALVDAGNYVGAGPGGTVLATIMQVAPVEVTAAVDERQALRLRARIAAAGTTPRDGIGRIAAYAQQQGDTARGEAGVLDFVDHQVAPGSGSIAVRARFPNAERRLLPGFYARLTLEFGAPREALVVPDAAVLSDQQGEFLYVIERGIARRRNVRTVDLPGALREVLDGVRAQESIALDGNDRLGDGRPVTVVAPGKTGGAP